VDAQNGGYRTLNADQRQSRTVMVAAGGQATDRRLGVLLVGSLSWSWVAQIFWFMLWAERVGCGMRAGDAKTGLEPCALMMAEGSCIRAAAGWRLPPAAGCELAGGGVQVLEYAAGEGSTVIAWSRKRRTYC
jgi:hypothetical protein